MKNIRVQLYYKDMGVWRKDSITTISEADYNTILRVPALRTQAIKIEDDDWYGEKLPERLILSEYGTLLAG
jgi:hypothetical protein